MPAITFFVVDITAVDGIGFEHYKLIKFSILPRLLAEAEAKAYVIDNVKKARQLTWATYKSNPFSLIQDILLYVR